MPMTTDNLTDTKINLRLAGALDVDLTAQTEEQIEKAVMGGVLNDHSGVFVGMLQCLWNDRLYAVPYWGGMTLWNNRIGKEWQADIEAHVAAYRRTPPNWAGDLETAYLLKDEIKQRRLGGVFAHRLSLEISNRELCGVGHFEICFATAHDIALAALRTLEEAKDER